MDPALHNVRAFFGRRKGHKLRPRQAQLFETLLPSLALDLSGPAPTELALLFVEPVAAVCLEIGFGGGEAMLAEAKAHRHVGFIGVEPFVNGMAKALAGIQAEGLQNIRLHFDDALALIAWLPRRALSGSISFIPIPGRSGGIGSAGSCKMKRSDSWRAFFAPAANFVLSRISRITRPGRCSG